MANTSKKKIVSKLSEKKMDKLVEEVTERIIFDLNLEDRTAIAAMLSWCPIKNLVLFLPINQQHKYTK